MQLVEEIENFFFKAQEQIREISQEGFCSKEKIWLDIFSSFQARTLFCQGWEETSSEFK